MSSFNNINKGGDVAIMNTNINIDNVDIYSVNVDDINVNMGNRVWDVKGEMQTCKTKMINDMRVLKDAIYEIKMDYIKKRPQNNKIVDSVSKKLSDIKLELIKMQLFNTNDLVIDKSFINHKLQKLNNFQTEFTALTK